MPLKTSFERVPFASRSKEVAKKKINRSLVEKKLFGKMVVAPVGKFKRLYQRPIFFIIILVSRSKIS